MFRYQREGVRYMANGLKVYHLPLCPWMNGDVSFVALLNIVPLLRQIFIREHVDVCHGHLSTSITMAMIMVLAKAMGIKTVCTEHSHFVFKDLDHIGLNKMCKWYLREVDATICVSHASRDNFTLRAKINPNKCFTIPNAVDTNKFQPNPSLRFPLNTINIVIISRLAHKKGIDLLVDIIPEVLERHPNAYFIIRGFGEKYELLEQLVHKYNLKDKVDLGGGIPHHQVPYVLNRGHIFLNTSLSETFCLSMLEAASCGLLVVSTDVGGIPEVLPPGMAYLAKPDAKSLKEQLYRAMKDYDQIQTQEMHQIVKNMYSWHYVAERTERCYDFVME
jgi:phosphatidylinositol N-acetylglucosaminyltransferase subunit A